MNHALVLPRHVGLSVEADPRYKWSTDVIDRQEEVISIVRL